MGMNFILTPASTNTDEGIFANSNLKESGIRNSRINVLKKREHTFKIIDNE